MHFPIIRIVQNNGTSYTVSQTKMGERRKQVLLVAYNSATHFPAGRVNTEQKYLNWWKKTLHQIKQIKNKLANFCRNIIK